MVGRRLLALLVAVLCAVLGTVARLGVLEGGGKSPADGVEALAGPGLVCRTSSQAAAEPVGSAPDDHVDSLRAPGSITCVALIGPWCAPRAVGPARDRRGDPKASRGPPSSLVS
jgi:hypothetical protein